MEKIVNPFFIKGYVSKQLFCNRKAELEILHRNLQNGANTTIISPRKMGKSGLIFRYFDDLNGNNEIEHIYVDIYASRSLSDFIKLTAEAILLKFSEKTKIGSSFIKFLKGLRPLISFDPFTGNPQIQISYQTSQETIYTLHGLFQFLESQNKKIILAFDEFQQIGQYPDDSVEAVLRTYIQQLKNVFFIFCGSNKSMMVEMFTSAKRPFFASTRLLSLGKIDRNEYTAFIRKMFEKYHKSITDEAIIEILDLTKQHTFYTQNLCNTIFSMKFNEVTHETVKIAMADLLKENEPYFYQYRQFLTPAQWNFLIAVANEDEVVHYTAHKFISKYNIGTPANAKRLLKSLTEKELILETQSENSTIYQVYDVFLSRWLKTTY